MRSTVNTRHQTLKRRKKLEQAQGKRFLLRNIIANFRCLYNQIQNNYNQIVSDPYLPLIGVSIRTIALSNAAAGKRIADRPNLKKNEPVVYILQIK